MLSVRYAHHPEEFKQYTTQRLRAEFLQEKAMQADGINLVYTHYDRAIFGGIMPVNEALSLGTYTELKAAYFFERREAGIINTGGQGSIEVDGVVYELHKLDCLYIAKGSKEVVFKSANAQEPAKFFFFSGPAHKEYPVQFMPAKEANPTNMGTQETANCRTIYKYIHLQGLQSCQVVMGLTVLEKGNIWNTMPSHTHDRRMEAYYYFDLPADAAIIHLMGEPNETRHLVVQNEQAILSPPWSIHSGVGTQAYTFIWCMCGENKDYTDMDPVVLSELK